MSDNATWVGRSLPRFEDGRLLSGQGQFIADLNPFPGIRHAAILRSPYPHANIRRIDVRAARALDGVVGVVTGQDIVKELSPFPVGVAKPIKYYPLAIDRVRYVGEPVAVVVAESRYVAEDALESIQVEYEPLPVVLDVEAATTGRPGALHAGVDDNVANHRVFRYGDPDAAMQEADVVFEERFVYPRNTAVPIEGYGVIAHYDASVGDYTVWANFHGPFTLHSVMAHALKVGTQKLRIKTPTDIGGSYGVKSAIYVYMVLMAVVSRLVGAAVKWTEDRLEHMQASSSASSRVSYVRAAFSRNGRLLALLIRQYDDVGAYIRAPEPATLYRVHGNLTGAYDVRHVLLENYAVMTNRVPTGLVRGYGGPQLYFPLERMMDIAARRLGLDPVTLRRRNLIKADQFPYTTASGGIYDSGNYEKVLEDAVQKAGYWSFEKARARRDQGGGAIRHGIGIALVVEPSGSNMGYVTVAFTPEERARQLPKSGAVSAATVAIDMLGGVTVQLDSAPEGQGHETVARQIVADVLSVAPDDIRVIAELDTAITAWTVSSGSYSSRFAAAGASAVFQAAKKVKDRLLRLAAHQLGAQVSDLVLHEGGVWHNGVKTSWSVKRLAGLMHWNPAGLPSGLAPGVYETAYFSLPEVGAPSPDDRINSSATYGFLVDVAKVAVNIETGRVRVLDYITVHDAGRLLNPLLADGQIYGGLAFGVGSALYEELLYDDQGQLMTGSLIDYLVPTLAEMPDHIRIYHHATPAPGTPLGAKGLGEGNVMSAGAAIANAVSDALGVEIHTLPLSPQAVFDAIHQMRREDRR